MHANLPALEAVLNDAGRHNYHEIWNVGDFVGYYPFPNEVIDLLRNRKAISIAGNYDLKVLAFEKNKEKWKNKKAPEKYLAFEWTYETLTKQNRKYLASLPEEIRLEVNGLRVLLTHGSPASNEEYICAETTQQRLEELAAMAKADIVLSGHSHLVFSKQVGKTLFINPGSVGRPEGTEGRATYAILKFGDKSVDVENYEVEYDIEKTIRAIRKAKLPEDFIKMLRQGKNLTQLKKGSSSPSQKQQNEQLDSVIEFAESCNYEEKHTKQVTKLALRLFDELKELHKMSEQEKFYLHCGGLLHDIGWIKGQKAHHKTALNMIIQATDLPFDLRQRAIIGLIARYHRKALPKPSHKHFCNLTPQDQHMVSVLAGILRVADGFDISHRNLVKDVKCKVTADKIFIRLDTSGPVISEIYSAEKKADLMRRVFDKEIIIEVSE